MRLVMIAKKSTCRIYVAPGDPKHKSEEEWRKQKLEEREEMTPDRKEIVDGKKVEEYYWGGKMVVYIDNHFTEMTFEEAVEDLRCSCNPKHKETE
jgi:hypothetical protein